MTKKHHSSWIARTSAKAFLTLMGWKIIDNFEGASQGVVLGVPHTSNWDGIMAIPLLFALDVNFRWIGKDSLFKGIRGPFTRALGGIPIDRSRHQNFVQQAIELFDEQEDLFIVIAPEGTRKYTPHWKSGFYHIAQGAKVPIMLGYIDYQRKQIGVDGRLDLSGDLETDLAKLRAFYEDKIGRHPENKGEIRFEPEKTVS
jgi:1-acyl-sn-glycerol-3-phosphate acyltransferase